MTAKQPARPDRRTARTKRALHEALMQLMLERGFEAISVSNITDRANVGRSTFYAHYADKEDLLQESLRGLREHLQSGVLAPPDARSSHPALTFAAPMFHHVAEVRDMFRALAGDAGGVVREHLRQTLVDLVREQLLVAPPPNRADPGLAAEFIVGAFLAVCVWWVNQPTPLPPEEAERAFRDLAERGLEPREGWPNRS